MSFSTSPDFVTPPDDPNAPVDPNATPYDPSQQPATDPGVTFDPTAITADVRGYDPTQPDPTQQPQAGASAPAEVAPPTLPGDPTQTTAPSTTSAYDDPVRLAQQKNQGLASGSAFGGAPTGPAANTATFPGDPATGQASAAPSPTATAGGVNITDAINAGTAPGTSVSPVGPTVPGAAAGTPGGTPTSAPAGAGGGVLNDAQWAADFQKQNGFYDPTYNSRENMLYNAQRGDVVIRDQLAKMAPQDADAQRVMNGINANPGFRTSPAEADWIAQHDAQITQREQALGGAGGGGQASPTHVNGRLGTPPGAGPAGGANYADIANLEAQRVAQIHPGTVQETMPIAAKLMDTLTGAGATGVTYDAHTNTVRWTDTAGMSRLVGGATSAGMADWANTAQKLFNGGMGGPQPTAQPAPVGSVASASAPQYAQPTHYAPSAPQPTHFAPAPHYTAPAAHYTAPAPHYTQPAGGGGGGAPVAPPTAPGQVMPSGIDVTNDIGSSAGYDNLAAQRLAAFSTMGPGGTRPAVPRSVASAVAYSPAIMPGGFSPYDQ